MSKALFITTADLKRYSILNGNVDADKFIQFIDISQDIHIQNFLGTDLYEKFQSEIKAGTLTGAYKTLLDEYIKPMVIHWALVEYLPFSAYTISSKGMFKHTSENSETVSKEEVDYLAEKHRSTAQHYTKRFIDYMCYHSESFPEYDSNTNEDIRPSTEANFGGWVI